MRLSHLRLGFRLARRELRRRPWRTTLVLLMVLVPSAAMTLVVVSTRTSEWSPADEQRARDGRADASAYSDQGIPPTQEDLDNLLAVLPPGTRMQVTRSANDRVRTNDQRTYFDVSDTELDDPMNDGRFGAVRGRLATSGSEVVITTDLADELDAAVGDRFRLDALDREVRVVGIVRPNSSAESAFVGARLPAGPSVYTSILFDLPDRLDAEVALQSVQLPGWQISWLGGTADDSASGIFWAYLGGGVGLIVLSTVITAAFAVGARRQLRSIGLLAASGAAPVTVKWFLVAQGAVAGAVGSVAGVLLVVVGLRLVPDRVVETLADRPIGGPIVRVADLVPIVAIGIVVAAGASWLPARSAARVPTLQALAGRRPLPKVPRRLPILGSGAVAGGCALLAMAVAGSRAGHGGDGSSLWALVAVVGGLGVVMGSVAVGPWVVAGLERAGRGLRPGGRLASRSLARNRVRSSAVIGAICAVAIVVVAGTTLYGSGGGPGDDSSLPHLASDQVVIDSYQPFAGESVGRPAPRVAQRIRKAVPGVEVIPIRSPRFSPPTQIGVPSHGAAATFLPEGPGKGLDTELQGVAVATEPLLDHLEVPEHLRAALDRGEAVTVSPVSRGIESVRIHLPSGPSAQPGPGPVLGFGGSFESPKASTALRFLLVGQVALERAGLGTAPSASTLVVLPDDMTDGDWDRLELLRDDLSWELEMSGAEQVQPFVSINLPDRPPLLSESQIKALLLAAAALLVLAVVAVGLALAAQDEAEERQILDAVGAPPRTVRRVTAMKAGLLALIAGAIAVPAGLLPAATIVAAASSDRPGGDWELRPDIPGLLLVLVVVPVLAATVTWAGGRLRGAIVRSPRPDVFAFGD